MYKIVYNEIENVEVNKSELKIKLKEEEITHYCWTKRGMEKTYNKYDIAIQLGDYGIVVKDEIGLWQAIGEMWFNRPMSDKQIGYMKYEGNGKFVSTKDNRI